MISDFYENNTLRSDSAFEKVLKASLNYKDVK